MITQATFRVSTAEQLIDALARAASGEVICIDDRARIDLTGRQCVTIPGGVTLAGVRGHDGSQGGLLFTKDLGAYDPAKKSRPLFVTGGPGVRVTGLRIEGPDSLRRTAQMMDLYRRGGVQLYHSMPSEDGIEVLHEGFEIDNCELWNWTWSAVRLEPGAHNAHVHHNYIHHCQRQGLGYGVYVDQVASLIEYNQFDWCRHAIAGTGRPGTSYEACDNLIDAHANGHAFDMHGGRDRQDGSDLAGDWMRIHHNTFRLSDLPAILIRGRPAFGVEIHHNRFAHETIEQAVRQQYVSEGMKIYRNMVKPADQLAE